MFGHNKAAILCIVGLLASPATRAVSGAVIQLEGGSIALPQTTTGSEFETVIFAQPFSVAPVVFALPTNEGGDPCDLRIRNVTSAGFEVIHVEPPGEDGPHAPMTVSWFAIEPGRAILPDGRVLEAGTIDSTATVQKGGTKTWESITFGSVFADAPALLAQVQTMVNEAGTPPGTPSTPWLTAAVHNLDANGAQIAMEQAETAGAGTPSADETLGYVAVSTRPLEGAFRDANGNTIVLDPLVSTQVIRGWDDTSGTGNWVDFVRTFAAPPLVVGNQATRNGDDGGWLRSGQVTPSGVYLMVDEDRYQDSERNHTAERASVLAFSQSFGIGATALPVPKLTYAAQKDTTANNVWENVEGIGSHNWSLASNSRTAVSVPPTWELTEAYVFPDARATAANYQNIEGADTTEVSASFEMWFKPDDLTGQEILWEIGGREFGTSLALDDDQLLFTTSSASDPTTRQLRAELAAASYTQAVGVIDMHDTADYTDLLLYLNGRLVDTEFDVTDFTSWAGGDGTGLGRVEGSAGGNKTGLLDGFGDFHGEIALVRFYDQALSAGDVWNLYASVVPEPGTLSMLIFAAVALLLRRRRR